MIYISSAISAPLDSVFFLKLVTMLVSVMSMSGDLLELQISGVGEPGPQSLFLVSSCLVMPCLTIL